MSGLVAVLLLQLAGALGGGAPRDHAEHHRAALGANGSENEYLFYQFAAAAYCSDSALDAWSCMPCLKANQTVRSLKRFENTSTDIKSYVAALDDGSPRIVVGFRGTETLTNWIENLRLATTDRNMSCAGCKVHHGFLDAFLSVAPGVLAEVHRLQALWPGAPLFTTGHSLGAALATLCAYTMEYDEGMDVEGVFTYGSPRVGNAAFANFYNGDSGTHVSWRVTHHRDPVPHLPPMLVAFRHIATEIFHEDDAIAPTRICDGSGEDPRCSNQYDVTTSVHDHLNYYGQTIGVDGGC